MDLHPVTILLALIFWGMIWGFVGALLATPITAVVRILLDKAEVTRPLAELMAGRLPGESPPPVRSTA
jgi:AI-2 transport protein TqsA